MMRLFLPFYEIVNIYLTILITDCAQGNSIYNNFIRVTLGEPDFRIAIQTLFV